MIIRALLIISSLSILLPSVVVDGCDNFAFKFPNVPKENCSPETLPLIATAQRMAIIYARAKADCLPINAFNSMQSFLVGFAVTNRNDLSGITINQDDSTVYGYYEDYVGASASECNINRLLKEEETKSKNLARIAQRRLYDDCCDCCLGEPACLSSPYTCFFSTCWSYCEDEPISDCSGCRRRLRFVDVLFNKEKSEADLQDSRELSACPDAEDLSTEFTKLINDSNSYLQTMGVTCLAGENYNMKIGESYYKVTVDGTTSTIESIDESQW